MGYTTFSTLLDWLQEPYGLTVRDNRHELARKANDIRQHFYLLYEKVQMFMDLEECFCVQRFTNHCDPCGGHYFGFTLPPYIQQVEKMDIAGAPITLLGRWRGYRADFRGRAGCRLESSDLGDGFCTERDIGDCPVPVKFIALSPRDCGKTVRVSYYDEIGKEACETITLAPGYTATSSKVARFKHPCAIVFSAQLEGGVIVAACTDASPILSEYCPGELIPNMRRRALTNVCERDVVRVTASRRYTPLYHDQDIVETDNKQAFVEMALSFKFTRSQSTDPQLLQKGAVHEQRAKQYLLGDKARDEGGAVVRRVNMLGKRVHRSGLPTRRPGCWPYRRTTS
jgi:hypothetical protein